MATREKTIHSELGSMRSCKKERCIYRVVPLIGKALFMPEEFILNPVSFCWWWEDAEITGFPWWRWKTTEVRSAEPLEVMEEPSAAMGFKSGWSFLYVEATLRWYLVSLLLGGNELVLLSSTSSVPWNLSLWASEPTMNTFKGERGHLYRARSYTATLTSSCFFSTNLTGRLFWPGLDSKFFHSFSITSNLWTHA